MSRPTTEFGTNNHVMFRVALKLSVCIEEGHPNARSQTWSFQSSYCSVPLRYGVRDHVIEPLRRGRGANHLLGRVEARTTGSRESA